MVLFSSLFLRFTLSGGTYFHSLLCVLLLSFLGYLSSPPLVCVHVFLASASSYFAYSNSSVFYTSYVIRDKYWTPNESIFKLIIMFCLPKMVCSSPKICFWVVIRYEYIWHRSDLALLVSIWLCQCRKKLWRKLGHLQRNQSWSARLLATTLWRVNWLS